MWLIQYPFPFFNSPQCLWGDSPLSHWVPSLGSSRSESSQPDCWRNRSGLQSPSQNSDCPAHDSLGHRTYIPSIRLSRDSEIRRSNRDTGRQSKESMLTHRRCSATLTPALCWSLFLLLSHQPSELSDSLPVCFLLARFTDSLVCNQRSLHSFVEFHWELFSFTALTD